MKTHFSFRQISQVTACALCVVAIPSLSFAESSDGGISAGKFENRPFKISADIRQGWDSNPNTSSTDEQSSAFTGGDITLSMTIGKPRTQLLATLTGGTNYYYGGDINDPNQGYVTLGFNLTHNLNRKITLNAKTYTTYQIQPDWTNTLGLSTNSGYYFYSNSAISMGYQWSNKLSTNTSLSYVGVFYDDQEVAETEDRSEGYFSQDIRFLVLPSTTLIAEYRLAMVTYNENNDQDSLGNYALLGVDHNFTPRLRTSVRGGIQFIEYDNRAGDTRPYGEGTLSYSYAKNSTISWTARYGTEQSNLIGDSTTNMTLRTGLNINHGLTARIRLNLGVYYQNTQYKGFPDSATDINDTADLTDDTYNINASISFAVHRNLNLRAGYEYTQLLSDSAVREYDRQQVYIGLGATF